MHITFAGLFFDAVIIGGWYLWYLLVSTLGEHCAEYTIGEGHPGLSVPVTWVFAVIPALVSATLVAYVPYFLGIESVLVAFYTFMVAYVVSILMFLIPMHLKLKKLGKI